MLQYSLRCYFQNHDFSSFRSLDEALLTKVDEMLSDYIPQLLSHLPEDVIQLRAEPVAGGVFDLMDNSIFSQSGGE